MIVLKRIVLGAMQSNSAIMIKLALILEQISKINTMQNPDPLYLREGLWGELGSPPCKPRAIGYFHNQAIAVWCNGEVVRLQTTQIICN